MDICLDCRVLTSHFPGVGRYASGLIEALPDLLEIGERLVLLHDSTSGGRPGPAPFSPFSPFSNGADFAAASLAPAARERISWRGVRASPFSLAQQWRVPRALRGARGVYHAPYYLMPYRSGLPALVTVCDLIPVRAPTGLSLHARLLFRALLRLAVGSCAAVITISESTRRDLLAFAPVQPERVSAIPLAAGTPFAPQPQAERARVQARYDLPGRYALYVGINKPHKNLPRLIEAWARAARGHTARERGLVVAGPWDARYPEAKQAAERLGVAASVRFLGPVDEADLPALYSGAHAFVFPSFYEGFGLPVLEAMACGAPVACSNRSSLPEVAGDAALLFDPANTDAMAAAVARLFEEPALRQDLAARGLAQSGLFSWERTARATLALYRRLAG